MTSIAAQNVAGKLVGALGWVLGTDLAQADAFQVTREQLAVIVVRGGALILFFSQFLHAELQTKLHPLAKGFIWFPIFTGVVTALVFGVSFTTWFTRHWRGISLGLCSAVLASLTWATTLTKQDDILFCSYLLFITSTGGLVPWEDRWQVAFNLIAVGLWSVGAHAIGAKGALLWLRSLAILAGLALSQAMSALRNYRRRQADVRIVALAESRHELMAEAERRAAVIARLERTEKQLRQSEEKLRKVFEASPDVIAINSLVDGRCIEVNPAFEKTGYRKDEALKLSAGDHCLITDHQQLDRFVSCLKRSGHVYNMKMNFRRKDGVVQPSLVSAATVELDGEPCAVTVARDVSQLERAEHELVEAREVALAASRAKSDFLSSMSHEI